VFYESCRKKWSEKGSGKRKKKSNVEPRRSREDRRMKRERCEICLIEIFMIIKNI